MDNINHQKLLETYLRIAFAGNAESKEIIEREVPKTLGAMWDGKPVAVRELLITEGIEGTNLIPTEVIGTVMRGGDYARCMRDALRIVDAKGPTTRVPLGSATAYAPEVAEGARIGEDNENYSYADIVIKKYGQRPEITSEMVEDAVADVIAEEVFRAGVAIENTLNQLALTELLDNAGNEHDCTGSNLGIKAVAGAMTLIKVDGFKPDKVIMSPELEGLVAAEFVPTAYTGSVEVMNTGLPPKGLLGLQAYSCGVADDSDTYAWEYNSDGDIGGIVIDSGKAAAIGMRRDIKLDHYKDPIRDLVGMTATGRFGVKYLHANAICRIEY